MPDLLGDISYTWPFPVGFLCAYLLGSVPFGLILTRLKGYGDLRQIGSGNIGATNVLRTGNKALAAVTLVLDGGKGSLAVVVASGFGPDMVWFAGLGVFLGHLFPVWLKFKGGKGVATFLGVFLAAAWPVGLASMVIWLTVAAVLRYSSLAALTAIGAAPIMAWLIIPNPTMTSLAAILAALVFIKHRANIRRLLTGREPKIGLRKTTE